MNCTQIGCTDGTLLNDEEAGKDIIQEAFINLWNMETKGEMDSVCKILFIHDRA